MISTHLFYTHFGNIPEPWANVAVADGGGLILMGYYSTRLLRLNSRQRLLRLGYDGEVEVAQELNQMMSEGFQVYHDFPAEGFNIDHVLIGPIGVMAIETKAGLKGGKTSNKGADAVVNYDGRMLHFPKYSDHESIDHAKRQAAWLSQWLSSVLGEDICARAMVAIPGWYVKRTSADGIPVVNPKQFENLFKHIKPRPLTEGMIQRIARHVEHQFSASDAQSDCCYNSP